MIARAPSWQVSLPSYRGDQINRAHHGAIEFRFGDRSDKQMRAAAAQLRGGSIQPWWRVVMRTIMQGRLVAASAAVLLMSAAAPASAQQFPGGKPIEMTVMFG